MTCTEGDRGKSIAIDRGSVTLLSCRAGQVPRRERERRSVPTAREERGGRRELQPPGTSGFQLALFIIATGGCRVEQPVEPLSLARHHAPPALKKHATRSTQKNTQYHHYHSRQGQLYREDHGRRRWRNVERSMKRRRTR